MGLKSTLTQVSVSKPEIGCKCTNTSSYRKTDQLSTIEIIPDMKYMKSSLEANTANHSTHHKFSIQAMKHDGCANAFEHEVLRKKTVRTN